MTKQNKIYFNCNFLRNNSVILILSFLFLISCDKNDDSLPNAIQSSSNDVSLLEASTIATSFFKQDDKLRKGISNLKTISDFKTYKTHKKENAFFVITYKQGGFVIIAADNRMSPVLAYSETDTFPTDSTKIIPPIHNWMEGIKEQTQYIKDNKLIQNRQIKLEWSNNTQRLPDETPKTCDNIYIQKGPLLTTSWGQRYSYNNLIDMVCPNSPGGKAPTGCVAVAIAQVMRYFHKDNTYNWNNMPPNFGTYDTQLLMKDIGEKIGMDYSCDGSGAETEDVASTLINGFGYSTASFTSNYSSEIVVQQINQNKPVILSGGRKREDITFPWNYYADGHAWVCDGYQSSKIYEKDDFGVCTGVAWTYLYLHMNWGWYGEHNNTWYSAQNFNPGTDTYNYERKIVYNITP